MIRIYGLTPSCCPYPEPHVAIAVVDLLQELTDIDTLHESEEGAEVLIDALVSSDGLKFLRDLMTLLCHIELLCVWTSCCCHGAASDQSLNTLMY